MSNPEYQSLIRCTGEEARGRLILPASDPHGVAKAIEDIPDDDLPALLADLGGHDIVELTEAFAQAKANPDAPTVVFAYTIKGWGLPIAGHPMNHSALLTDEQIAELRDDARRRRRTASGTASPRTRSRDGSAGPPPSACSGIDEQIPAPLVTPEQIPASLGAAPHAEVAPPRRRSAGC